LKRSSTKRQEVESRRGRGNEEAVLYRSSRREGDRRPGTRCKRERVVGEKG
jgi:hypothetical protein